MTAAAEFFASLPARLTDVGETAGPAVIAFAIVFRTVVFPALGGETIRPR